MPEVVEVALKSFVSFGSVILFPVSDSNQMAQ